MNDVGIIISGMPKIPRKGIQGFNKSIISVGNCPNDVEDEISDERTLCHSTDENFYSISTINDYRTFTIFNPTTYDHVGRNAYIAISIITKINETTSINPVSVLDKLMSIYMSNEENINETIFESELKNITTKTRSSSDVNGDNIGKCKVSNKSELLNLFLTLNLKNFKKVYYYDNNLNIENDSSLINFDDVRVYTGNILNINSSTTIIEKNGKKIVINHGESSKLIDCFEGDKIIIFNNNKKVLEHNVKEDFRFRIEQEKKESSKQRKTLWFKKPINLLLLIITFLVPISAAIYYFKFMKGNNVKTVISDENETGSVTTDKDSPDTNKLEPQIPNEHSDSIVNAVESLLDGAKSKNDTSTIRNNNDEILKKVKSEEGFFVDRKETKNKWQGWYRIHKDKWQKKNDESEKWEDKTKPESIEDLNKYFNVNIPKSSNTDKESIKKPKPTSPPKKENKIDWNQLEEKVEKIIDLRDESGAKKLLEKLKKLKPKNDDGEDRKDKLIDNLEGEFNL